MGLCSFWETAASAQQDLSHHCGLLVDMTGLLYLKVKEKLLIRNRAITKFVEYDSLQILYLHSQGT